MAERDGDGGLGIAAQLEELRRLEPPPEDPAQRDANMRAALDLAAAAATTARSLRVARIGRIAVPLAAAAALLIVWLVASGDHASDAAAIAANARPPAPLAVRSGSVVVDGVALLDGAQLRERAAIAVGAEPAELVLRDASRLQAARDTAFVYSGRGEDRFHLEHGEVVLRVEPRAKAAPLVVETAELSAWVVGTRFAVTRGKDGDVFATTVSVVEGLVRVVSKANGETQLLAAGGRVTLRAGGDAQPPAEPSAPSASAQVGASAEHGRHARGPAAPAHAAISTMVRQKLKEGAIGTARRLIERAQRERAAGDAELALLQAETDLADRRPERARSRYLAIVTRYPQTSEAELSLFAAAQLSRGQAGIDLLQRYLARYPDGRFAKEAHRLLRTLERGGAAP